MSDDKTFAFIGHPAYVGHLQRYLEWAEPGHREVSPGLLTYVFKLCKAYLVSELKGVRSATGEVRDGLFVTATLLPEMITLSPMDALQKTVDACVLADELGAKITTLGGHTSIAGAKAPELLLEPVSNHITTGNTLTSAFAVQQVRNLQAGLAADFGRLDLVVLGGTGDIGATCAEQLAPLFRTVTLTARNEGTLADTAARIRERHGTEVRVTRDNQAAVRGADVVIAATSAATAILSPEDFKPGAIVADVGYPKNIREAASTRDDILVYFGGLAHLEHEIGFGYDIDLPRADLLYGCFAEAMILDFERNYCSYSMGRGNITEEGMQYMLDRGEKHGYRPAPPCQGEEFLSWEQVDAIVRNNPRLRR